MQEEPKTIEQRIEEMLIAFAEDTGIEHEPVSAYTYKFLCFITQIVEEARRNTLDSFCIIVKNELRQQKLDGFSLDGTDFDAVFESAKKFILIKSIRI